MMIDEQVSIRSIMAALSFNKAELVAKQIDGISQKPFLAALRLAGYEYSQKSPKGWHYVGDGVEPLDKSIFDFVKRGSSRVKSVSQKVHTPVKSSNTKVNSSSLHTSVKSGNTEVDSSSFHTQFTTDEVRMIREMLKSFQVSTSLPVDTLHERVKQLTQGDKTRKTIVIDSTIGNRFDGFCDAEKVNKSDVLHLALLDFMDKYEGV